MERTSTFGKLKLVPTLDADVPQDVSMASRSMAVLGVRRRSVDHVLNEWVMSKPENGDTLDHQKQFVKELVLALRESEEIRAAARVDPLRSLRYLMPIIGLLISGLVYGSILWAKVSAMEGKMTTVDSISVISNSLNSLKEEWRAESERQSLRQTKLEDRFEKFIEQQNRLERNRQP